MKYTITCPNCGCGIITDRTDWDLECDSCFAVIKAEKVRHIIEIEQRREESDALEAERQRREADERRAKAEKEEKEARKAEETARREYEKKVRAERETVEERERKAVIERLEVEYRAKRKKRRIIDSILVAIATLIAVFVIATTFGKKADNPGLPANNGIDILAEELTIALGQTAELRINSSVSELDANYNDCIDTYWNNDKISGDDYYLEVTGVEEGICYLKVHDYNNVDLYDTVVIYVVSSDEDFTTGAGTDDAAEPPVVVKPALDVPAISASTLSIDSILPSIYSVEKAPILSYSGSITYDEQKDSYYFDAPYDGRYRMDISGLQSGTAVELYIFDSSGKSITSNTYCKNNEGITAKDLKASETYEVQVRHTSGYSNYELSIGVQKATIDISGLTQLTDSIEYIDQRNVYTFTAPLDGCYRFELSDMMSGTATELYVFNSLGETVVSYTYCKNGEGVTTKGLVAGETYQVQVRYASGFSEYKLSIGLQKITVDISGLTQLTDSIEYIDQRNVYTFTAPLDGCYRFELSDMMSGTATELYVFNSLGETVVSYTYCKNGEGVTAKGLVAGETYQVQVRYASGFSSYTLLIGQQKETVNIEDYTIVNDSIEYTDQRNVYSFTATASGDITILLSEMANGCAAELLVFNDLGETVASDTYCKNGDGVTLRNVSIGTHYEIQIRYSSGFCKYQLIISQ